MSPSAARYLKFIPVVVFGGIIVHGVAAAYQAAPAHTFDPFCSYSYAYRINVTIEAEGRQYSSAALVQRLHARRWIATLGGCSFRSGPALAFRLADNFDRRYRPDNKFTYMAEEDPA